MAPQVSPERLGRYVLLKPLAAGGMAEIYLARVAGPEDFKKLLVIKRIHKHLTKDERFVKMFFDEARIAARLTHPNIGQIFDLGESEGFPYIAMEYIQGLTLREIQERVYERKAMEWTLVAWLGARVCEGLAHAHALKDEKGEPAGLVHRDVSPQNVLVSFEGAVKLVDFGIAKASIKLEQTQSNSRKGKLRYMSPEQVLGLPLDHRSDLFSLGICLWELLSNKRLYTAEGDLGVMQEITQEPIPPLPRHIPDPLKEVVRRALEKEAEDRFADANEMAEALDQALFESTRSPNAKQMSEFLARISKQDAAKLEEEISKLMAMDLPPEPVTPAYLEDDPTRPSQKVLSQRKMVVAQATMVILAAFVAIAGVGWMVLNQPSPRTGEQQKPSVTSAAVANARTPEPPAGRNADTEIEKIPVELRYPGAKLEINGIDGNGAIKANLKPKKYRLHLEKVGYESQTVDVNVDANKPFKQPRVAFKPKFYEGSIVTDPNRPHAVYHRNRYLGDTFGNISVPYGTNRFELRPYIEGKASKRKRIYVTAKVITNEGNNRFRCPLKGGNCQRIPSSNP